MRKLININDYTYDLPQERIAWHPLPKRDESKLLVYQNGKISHHTFKEIPELIPAQSLLFFNDTKVIPARILFEKETGARIEVFLLNPEKPSSLVQIAMDARGSTTWKCSIGNLKRWPDQLILTKRSGSFELQARLLDRDEALVEFTWSPAELPYAEIVNVFGSTPLPPYIKREAEHSDEERYQTVYAHYEGAVAAPTAGLHFTDSVLKKINERGIITDFLTLHVGAGTFQPVKTENALDHEMHKEQVSISKKNIENLLSGKKIIAVGTTSMRVLESLYWYGVKLSMDEHAQFLIHQYDPYQMDSSLSMKESLKLVLKKLTSDGAETMTGQTSIYVYPGYKFKVCEGLITNFHQPGSTLILLVAAFAGEGWRKMYTEALEKNYRFLSYGDSSLLLK